jgi:hypothetical protein
MGIEKNFLDIEEIERNQKEKENYERENYL